MSVEDTFRENLTATRQKQNISQSELARRVGVSQQTIAKIEEGRQHVKLDQAYRLATMVGVALLDLLPDCVQRPDADTYARTVTAHEMERKQAKIRRLQRELGIAGDWEADWINRGTVACGD